jgi:histidinol-phosphate aminotransferase
LTNPNAPTGVHFEPEVIAQLAAAYQGILVIDETYAPFARTNCIGLLDEFPNLVITRSFSKAYSLAGMRVGYGLASAQIIEILDRVRDSYNVDAFAQVAAIAAIEDEDYYNYTITESNRLRQQYREVFEQYGWFVYPSEANFLFVEPLDAHNRMGAEIAEGLYNFLLAEKILVRYFPKHALTHTFLRISVGNAQEMDQLFEAIEKWRIKNNA